MEQAVDWAKKWPATDSNGGVRLEIRPFFEAEDFSDVLSPEERARQERLRAEFTPKNN
jgi:hypothetical protein